jgi:hypothetical protein
VDATDGIWGAVVALIGLFSVIYTGRRGPRNGGPQPLPSSQDVPTEQLQVSQPIWRDMQSKISTLEEKVDHLTVLMEDGVGREMRLKELLRMAMKVIRRANRRLRSAGEPEEPVPVELIPYAID